MESKRCIGFKRMLYAGAWLNAVNAAGLAARAAQFPPSTVIDSFYPSDINDTSAIVVQTANETAVGGSVSDPWGTYNYCNMPHPRAEFYEVPAADKSASLVFVEYVQRHHKRTQYNVLPQGEPDVVYDCSDVQLSQYSSDDDASNVNVYNNVYSPASNPFLQSYANGTCQYPQLTRGGLDDAVQHGQDLWDLYGRSLGVLPQHPNDGSVWLRTSNSALTQSTAGGAVTGVWPHFKKPVPLHQQPSSVDSIDQGFSCSRRSSLQEQYQSEATWKDHISAMTDVVSRINAVAPGVSEDTAWTQTFDHLCDNFQARLCNGYPLPCRDGQCVDDADANSVFRAGDWEWNYYWVTNPYVKDYITSVQGLFLAEVADRIEAVVSGAEKLKFSHTFAHDGDIGPIAGALGISALRWPGMGSNIAMELWKSGNDHYVRVLYCGSPIRSTAGDLSWMPVENFVALLRQYVPSEGMITFCEA